MFTLLKGLMHATGSVLAARAVLSAGDGSIIEPALFFCFSVMMFCAAHFVRKWHELQQAMGNH